jgi:hypothetical protein
MVKWHAAGMGFLGQRKQERLFELERVRMARRMANEDVTVLGEQLSELHYETLTTDLKGDIGEDYQKALDAYERAKRQLRETEGADVVRALQPVLEDGRFHLACVLARQEDRPLPQRLPSCFFNPQHGPSHSEVGWTPPGGVARRVPVCLPDRNRLANKLLPAVRMIRVGDRLVPWFAADEAFGLLGGKIDARRVREIRAHDYTQAARHGADPTTSSMRHVGGGAGLADIGGGDGGGGY